MDLFAFQFKQSSFLLSAGKKRSCAFENHCAMFYHFPIQEYYSKKVLTHGNHITVARKNMWNRLILLRLPVY